MYVKIIEIKKNSIFVINDFHDSSHIIGYISLEFIKFSVIYSKFNYQEWIRIIKDYPIVCRNNQN